MQGRNSVSGLPLEVEVSFDEIAELVAPCLDQISEHISSFVGQSSPEVQADLKNNNIYFVGGGPAVFAFPEKIEGILNLGIVIPESPTSVVARGTALIAENPGRYEKYFLS